MKVVFKPLSAYFKAFFSLNLEVNLRCFLHQVFKRQKVLVCLYLKVYNSLKTTPLPHLP